MHHDLWQLQAANIKIQTLQPVSFTIEMLYMLRGVMPL